MLVHRKRHPSLKKKKRGKEKGTLNQKGLKKVMERCFPNVLIICYPVGRMGKNFVKKLTFQSESPGWTNGVEKPRSGGKRGGKNKKHHLRLAQLEEKKERGEPIQSRKV